MNIELQMPMNWQHIIESDKHLILLPSGRVSGKSKNSVIYAVILLLANPYRDIVITRSAYGSMKDTTYAEFYAEFEELPDELRSQFEFKKSPLSIERAGNSGTIYFIGSGGANKDRTKGFHSVHKLVAVIVEEAQEFKTRESYDQFEASVRRNFGDDITMLVLGNPPCIKAHWFNLFTEQKKKDKDWLVCKMTWEDIIPFLNDIDIKEILKVRMLEPKYYDWMYGGEATGGLGQCYPMFRPDYHLINYDNRSNSPLLQDFRVVGCIIGCDGAVNKDSTALVPMFIMSNGQSVAGKIFYHNPQTMGVKGSHPLVENEISRWFQELIKENNLNNPANYYNSIPILFVVDSASTELIQSLRYYFGNRAEVYAIKKGTILQMVDVVQSAIGKNVVSVYDFGGYYDYTNNLWVKSENLLAYQLESLIWNEKQTGYDATIPNDVSDAFTYAVYFYYRQIENIVWLQDVANKRKDYYILKS